MGLRRRKFLGQKHHLHRPHPADGAGQQPGRAAVGDQTNAGEGFEEIGAVPGDDDA